MENGEYTYIEIETPFIGDFYFNKKNKKTIITHGGSEGGRLWSTIESKINDLLRLGYSVLSLAYFKEKNLPQKLERIPLDYCKHAVDWLLNKKYSKIAVMGLSKGAELALILASYFHDIGAVVAIVPGSVVFQGINNSIFRRNSSWVYKKKELPYVKLNRLYKGFLREIIKREYCLCYLHSLLKNKNEKAIIPVENIRGPILLLSGKYDTIWPSTYMSDRILDRLKEKQFNYSCEHLVFNTGHNVFEDNESWEKIKDFLIRVH